jgi:hypothetical protein
MVMIQLLFNYPHHLYLLWRDNAWYHSLIRDSETPLLRTPSSFFTGSTMDQSTSTDPVSEGTSIPTTYFISSGPSISYDFGGPSVPAGYQSLSGIFSGASTSPSLFHYPPWTTGMPGMHDMSGTTLSNIGQIPQTTIAPVSSTQPVSSQQLPLTSGTIVQSSLGQSIPTTMGQMSIGSMVSGGKPLPGSSSSTGGKPLPGSSSSLGGKPLPGLSSLTGGGNLFQGFFYLGVIFSRIN